MDIQKTLEGWTFQENGDLDCRPMLSYGVVPVGGGMAAILRLEWVTDPSFEHTASQQVVMTLPQVQEVIAGLTRVSGYMAAQLEADRSQSSLS